MKPVNMLVDFLVHVGIFSFFYAVVTGTYSLASVLIGMPWILSFSLILLIAEMIVDKVMGG